MLIRRMIKSWLPLALIGTGMVLLVYLIAQQVQRMNANDPQVQMAEDAAVALAGGAKPEELLPTTRVNMSESLSPYLVIYNADGKPLVGSGMLHGALPVLPQGVFQYVDQNGMDRVTWQPEAGLRMAAVIVGYQGQSEGYVLAGRSLREVESRVDQLGRLALFAWAILLTASFLLVAGLEAFLPDIRTHRKD